MLDIEHKTAHDQGIHLAAVLDGIKLCGEQSG